MHALVAIHYSDKNARLRRLPPERTNSSHAVPSGVSMAAMPLDMPNIAHVKVRARPARFHVSVAGHWRARVRIAMND